MIYVCKQVTCWGGVGSRIVVPGGELDSFLAQEMESTLPSK